jgi:peroxiredoxin
MIGMTVMGVAATTGAADVPTRAEDVKPLTQGQHAPSAALRDPTGARVELTEIYAHGPTMLVFYRGGWCPYCNVHLGQIQKAEAELRGMGFQVVAISPDRPEELAASLDKGKLTYRLLSDSDMTLTKAFGLAFRVEDQTLEKYKGFGIDLEKASGQSHHWLPVPAVYLVDTKGVIRFAHWNPDYKTRLGPEELVSAARDMTGPARAAHD